MLHHAQRLAREHIHQPVPGACGDGLAVMEDDVRRVRQILGLDQRAARGLVERLARPLLGLGKLLPRGQYLGVDAERSDARRDEVLVARLAHQRELPRHDGHDRLQRHDIGVIADARAGGVERIVEAVATQIVVHDIQKSLLAAREKVLPDAAAHVVIAVVGDLLLVVLPISIHPRSVNCGCIHP